jgi:hypothetical protein
MKTRRALWIVAVLFLAPIQLGAQELAQSAMTNTGSELLETPIVFQVAEAPRPNGSQVVGGYLIGLAVGFLAWRATDEPDGQHSHVRQDWGYTPSAHKWFVVGSAVGATSAVWALGHRRGAKGKLWSTAIGAAIPSIPFYFMDHPLVPFMMAWAGAPAQAIGGYVGYKSTSK